MIYEGKEIKMIKNFKKFHASTQFNESVSYVKSPKMSVFDLKWPKNGS